MIETLLYSVGAVSWMGVGYYLTKRAIKMVEVKAKR